MPHSKTIINGKEEPSVTEIIGVLNRPYLMRWYGKLGNQEADRVSKQSRTIGLKVHEMIEDYFNDRPLDHNIDPHILKLFTAWEDWWTSSNFKLTGLERKVISKKYRYGGTFDAIIEDEKGNSYLTDWKVSNNDDHFRYLQLAGYEQARYEEDKKHIETGLIVRIDNEAKIHIKYVQNLQAYVPLFVYLRKMYDFVNKRNKWKLI